jgi:hypothetical protein
LSRCSASRSQRCQRMKSGHLRSNSMAIGALPSSVEERSRCFRNGKVLNKRFLKVVEALALLEGDFVLDGELVAFAPQGRPSFELLQNNLSRSLLVYFYAFDLLNRDGEPLVN